MATEALIVRAVQKGGDRQVAHEVIRRHSVAAAQAMKNDGTGNDMLERLANDPEFPNDMDELRNITDPSRFVGRAPQQVDDFLADVIDPLLENAPASQRYEE